MDAAEQLELRVESVLRQIGFVQRDSIPNANEGRRSDPSVSGKQYVDQDELLRIVKREKMTLLHDLSEEAQTLEMVVTARKWRRLLAVIPYCVVQDILDYLEQFMYNNHDELVGYFDRDPTRKCHLIFRSLKMFNVPSPHVRETEVDNVGPYMGFIMRHVRRLSVYSAENLRILDKWMRPPMKTSVKDIEITDTYSTIDRVELHSLCPAIFSAGKSLHTAAISDKVLRFKNLARLTLHSDFSGADLGTIRQLPAHSLTSLKIGISTPVHVRFLSDTLVHLRKLKELHLSQHHTGDVWSDVAVALQNAPPSLRRLSYFHCRWDYDDDKRVKILSGMFSSTLAKSIEELHLKCWSGDLIGLAEFSRLKTLQLTHLEDATEVHALYSALRLIPSLTELSLRFSWESYDKPFTPVLSSLTDIVTELPGLQHLHVSIYTFRVNVSDSIMARFLAGFVQSEVKLHWSMDEHTGCVSFSPDMYRSFLTVLFHPRLRHLLHNFYMDDNLSGSHEELSKAVGDMYHAIWENGY